MTNRPAGGTLASAGLTAGALAGLVVWAGPALAWIDPLRRRLTPTLAGLGRPGHVALTFDDGPDPRSTPAVLDALDELGWRATFFLLGSMVASCPELAAEIAGAGHEVAVHGFDHRHALRRTPGGLARDLARAVETIGEASGCQPAWYRPPFGELSGGALWAARRVGLRPVLWTAWGRDWRAEATPDSVVADLQTGVLDGGTVLLHDSDCASAPGSWKATLAALPRLADVLASEGLAVGTLADHGVGGHPSPRRR